MHDKHLNDNEVYDKQVFDFENSSYSFWFPEAKSILGTWSNLVSCNNLIVLDVDATKGHDFDYYSQYTHQPLFFYLYILTIKMIINNLKECTKFNIALCCISAG